MKEIEFCAVNVLIGSFILSIEMGNHMLILSFDSKVVRILRKTCPCNEYSLKPRFYILKVGYAGVYLYFLFLFQNIDCGYSLEPPRPIYVLSKK